MVPDNRNRGKSITLKKNTPLHTGTRTNSMYTACTHVQWEEPDSLKLLLCLCGFQNFQQNSEDMISVLFQPVCCAKIIRT
jgi:hypothetical protein